MALWRRRPNADRCDDPGCDCDFAALAARWLPDLRRRLAEGAVRAEAERRERLRRLGVPASTQRMGGRVGDFLAGPPSAPQSDNGNGSERQGD